jgi:Protein of unknown function (DUF2917)
MQLVANNSALLLDRRQTVELIDAAGATAVLDKGCLWITMDGDRRDIVLGAGESWTVERNGRTLLYAEAPSTLRITEPPVEHPDHRALAHRLSAAIEWVERTFHRTSVPYY